MQPARHQYLQAMGIQVWHSREQLPGAKLVAGVDLYPADTTPAVAQDSVDSNALAEPQTFVSEAAITETGGTGDLSPEAPVPTPERAPESLPESEVASAPPVSKSVSESPFVEENPEFRLASIVFPGCCVVVTEVARQAVEPIGKAQLKFLKELLLSLGAEVSQQPLITLFNWPMLRTAGFDQSAGAARDASQAFLRGQKSKHEVTFVLLMGEQTGRFLLAGNDGFEESQGQLMQDTEQPRLLSYSIDQLFNEPTLKGQLWSDVQPLRVWLQQD